MTATDYIAIITAVGVLIGAITTAALKIIAALRENTTATLATTSAVEVNTADRAVKAADTNAKLDAVVEAVAK